MKLSKWMVNKSTMYAEEKNNEPDKNWKEYGKYWGMTIGVRS